MGVQADLFLHWYTYATNVLKTLVRSKKGLKMRRGFQEGVVYLVYFFEDDAYEMISHVQEYMCMYNGYGMVQLSAIGKNTKCCPEELWFPVGFNTKGDEVCADTKHKCITNSKWFA